MKKLFFSKPSEILLHDSCKLFPTWLNYYAQFLLLALTFLKITFRIEVWVGPRNAGHPSFYPYL